MSGFFAYTKEPEPVTEVRKASEGPNGEHVQEILRDGIPIGRIRVSSISNLLERC